MNGKKWSERGKRKSEKRLVRASEREVGREINVERRSEREDGKHGKNCKGARNKKTCKKIL